MLRLESMFKLTEKNKLLNERSVAPRDEILVLRANREPEYCQESFGSGRTEQRNTAIPA